MKNPLSIPAVSIFLKIIIAIAMLFATVYAFEHFRYDRIEEAKKDLALISDDAELLREEISVLESTLVSKKEQLELKKQLWHHKRCVLAYEEGEQLEDCFQ